MKTLFLLPFLLCGCINFSASQTFVDPETHIVCTNSVRGTFLLSKTAMEKIEVASRTKTTSKLIGAKNAETRGDAESIKALSDLIGNVMAQTTKAAVEGASKAAVP